MELNGAQVKFVGGGSQSVSMLSVKGKKGNVSENLNRIASRTFLIFCIDLL